jgi:manganese-dependent inorganic pyrophosphatase
MKDIIYITGHKNPDTDSICSAIAYSELKRKLGHNAVSTRLGDLNRETEFVLKYFKIEIPELLYTVKTQVSDLDMDVINPVSPEISVKTAWNIMKKNNIKSLPVVNENEEFAGIVTLSDITDKYMDASDNNIIASSKTPLRNIVETLNAKIICGSQEDFNTSGKVLIAATDPEGIEAFIDKGDIIITGNRKDTQLKSIINGANCIIVTCGAGVSEEVIEKAKENNVIIMLTSIDTFATARLINQSIPISYIMTTKDIVKFNIDDFIEEIREKMLKTRYRSYPVVDAENKIRGFISRYHLISPRRKKIILLDHNEKAQTVNGIEEADILEIIDHHRLGDIQTVNPIFIKNEPVGSTSTIIANMFFAEGIRPSKGVAGILCSAVLSDTIKFKSPTSTYSDRITAEKLAEIAGIDIEEFSTLMFKESSSIQGKSASEILYQDFKEFNVEKIKGGIGQVYTMDIESIKAIKEDLLKFIQKVCSDKGYSLLLLLVTDISKHASELLFAGDRKELVSKAFNVNVSDNCAYLPGVVSRKKQVLPNISAAINKI